MAWCGRQVGGGDEGSRGNGNAHHALQSGATLPLASLSTPHHLPFFVPSA